MPENGQALPSLDLVLFDGHRHDVVKSKISSRKSGVRAFGSLVRVAPARVETFVHVFTIRRPWPSSGDQLGGRQWKEEGERISWQRIVSGQAALSDVDGRGMRRGDQRGTFQTHRAVKPCLTLPAGLGLIGMHPCFLV